MRDTAFNLFPRLWQRLVQGVMVVGLVVALWAPRPALAAGIVHIVQPGENLFRIGLKYGVGWQAIMAANGLYNTNIYVGQSLVIPGTTADPTPPPADPPPPPDPGPAPEPAPASGTYVVQRGDTLWLIAQRFGMTVADLMRLNHLANPNLIFSGTVLVVAGDGAAAAPGKVLNVSGRAQALPLDCESRSAVDWAAYFGVTIDEMEFFSLLPASDDPDTGFVGDVRGGLGQLPPGPYGVNAGPIAGVLQAYGVPVRAVTGFTWDQLRAEIDANRPVITWVIGAVGNGTAVSYTAASNGHTTTVAAYEHTVMVIGYGADSVTILDGGSTYTRTLTQFLASWGVLGNMAVVGG